MSSMRIIGTMTIVLLLPMARAPAVTKADRPGALVETHQLQAQLKEVTLEEKLQEMEPKLKEAQLQLEIKNKDLKLQALESEAREHGANAPEAKRTVQGSATQHSVKISEAVPDPAPAPAPEPAPAPAPKLPIPEVPDSSIKIPAPTPAVNWVTMTTLPERIADPWFKETLTRTISMCQASNATLLLQVPIRSQKGVPYDVPVYVKGLQGRHFRIQRVTIDEGPITKLLPALRDESIKDDDTVVVADDDIVYKSDIFALLIDSVRRTPGSISCMCRAKPQGYAGFAFRKRVLQNLVRLTIPDSCRRIDDDVIDWFVKQNGIRLVTIKYARFNVRFNVRFNDGSWMCSLLKDETDKHPKWDELVTDERGPMVQRCVSDIEASNYQQSKTVRHTLTGGVGYINSTETVNAPDFVTMTGGIDNDMNWALGAFQAEQMYCHSIGRTLCTIEQICPDGDGSVPVMGTQSGDKWVAYYDPAPDPVRSNAWVQIGDHRMHMLCRSHHATHGGVPKGLPSWGTASQKMILFPERFFMDHLVCCQ